MPVLRLNLFVGIPKLISPFASQVSVSSVINQQLQEPNRSWASSQKKLELQGEAGYAGKYRVFSAQFYLNANY